MPENNTTAKADETNNSTPNGADSVSEESKGFFKNRGWQFYVILGIGGVIAILFIILVIAGIIGYASGKTSDTASAVAIVRDLFIILLTLEGILIGVALIVLIVQLAKLVNILQNEIQPIVDSAQEAVSTVKGTAEFMSKNVTTPAIKASSYLAGARAFIREMRAISRLTKPTSSKAVSRSESDQDSN
ncbi:MAG: hypothetical protein BroJett018_19520 [Chloroflexota bacterium]|nr:hypothetical protein [Chloroflexota bacterium]NOG62465.1 hypothetical protein [Chloroflexota bacterium]GIK64158.1 MAG: hypothetical protein BroJett018_19520 [Chloroflexota bacterium]